jgi:predicted HTH transcriptional regulator
LLHTPFTDQVLAELGLNDRQLLAVRQAKTNRQITNADYQKLAGVPHRTAARDLMGLVRLGVFEHHGKGPAAFYVITRNRATIVPNVPMPVDDQATGKRAKNVPEVPKTKASQTQSLDIKTVKLKSPSTSAPVPPVETPVKTRANSPKTRVETPEQILAIFAADPVATLAQVAARIGKSQSAVERATAKLVKAGRLRHIGPTKAGHWELIS